MRDLHVPPKYRGIAEKAKAGRRPKAAIRTHCLYCTGWDSRAVRECTAPWCPLYPYRLGAGAKDKAAKKAELPGEMQHKSLREALSSSGP